MVRITGVGATLALLLAAAGLSGCGGAAAHARAVGACTARTPPHVTVVVESSPARVLDRCVPVGGRSISAETAMRRSGIELALQHFSFGDAVCQLDHVPHGYTQCFSAGTPYWSLFVAAPGRPFHASTTGISALRVGAGSAIGWHYVPARGPDTPPPLPTRG